MDDRVITPDLTANLALNPSPPAAFGDQPVATLTIINDDSEINFSSPTYTVSKNAINGAATINILRQGSASGTSSVAFTTGGGTATMGTDYTPVSQMVVFSPGVTNVPVTIPIINNGLAEGNLTVGLQLSGATGSLLDSPSNAVLTIIDTAHAPGQLSFAATNYFVTEGGGAGYTNAIITVARTSGTYGVVSAYYSTQDGTALAGVKYAATNGTVTLGDGVTSKTFTVRVYNATTAEGPESLFLLLTTNATTSGGATLAAPATATLTILNTNIGIAFSARDLRHQRAFRQSAGLRQFERPPLQRHQRPDDRPLRHHQRHRRGRHQLHSPPAARSSSTPAIRSRPSPCHCSTTRA